MARPGGRARPLAHLPAHRRRDALREPGSAGSGRSGFPRHLPRPPGAGACRAGAGGVGPPFGGALATRGGRGQPVLSLASPPLGRPCRGRGRVRPGAGGGRHHLAAGAPNASVLAQGPRDAVVPVATQGWVGQEAALTPALRTGLVADNSMSRQPAESAQTSFSRNASETAAERAGKLVIIRDPQLDEFLAAHRELTSSGTFVPPAGLVRSVAFEAPAGR